MLTVKVIDKSSEPLNIPIMNKSSNQEGIKETNLIKTCIRKSFDNKSYAKFQQVLEYLEDVLVTPLYSGYNTNLLDQLQNLSTYVPYLPEGLTLQQIITLKVKFYSFRFISNVGLFILHKLDTGEEKVKENYLTLIKILLHHALTSKGDTANLALVELEQLCASRKLTLNDLYNEYRPKFLRLIIKAILHKLISNGYGDHLNGNDSNSGYRPSWPGKSNCVIRYMTRALEVFNVTTITSEDIAQSLIITTNLLHKEEYNDSIKRFLNYLANYQNIDLCTLIRSHIQAIVFSLLLEKKHSHSDMMALLNKLCSFCDKTPSELLATKFTFIKGRLILSYYKDARSVKDGIYFLSKFEKEENEQPFEDEFEDERHFIDYLNPSMIGILLGVDYHFTFTRKELGSKESIDHIRGLQKILSLLNSKQVKAIHVKLLSTLCLMLRLRPRRDNHDLNLTLVDLWKIFVAKLDKELKVSLLINICVALYDLIEDCPEAVASLYIDLLCKQDPRTLSEKLKSLFFIPNTPAMSKVYSYLTSFVTRENSAKSLTDLQKSLDCVLPLLKLENQKCRMIALTKIKQLLQTNQYLLINNMLVNSDEPLDGLISKTIESLLALTSTQDSGCLALIAECLGIIGAINPIRLDHLIYGELPGKKSSSITNLTAPLFIANLIERLKNSLFSDQRSESESANYALQVVVKNFSVFKDLDGLLSSEALRACELCKNTNYIGAKKAQPDLTLSVYEKLKCDNQYSYREWLDKFSLNLISSIQDKKIQEVLYACSYIFKYNLKLAEYLLPLAIVHVIITQPNQADKATQVNIIKQEFLSIVDEDVGVSTQDLDTVYSKDLIGNIKTLHFQCANMVFCALDVVNKLYCDSFGSKTTPTTVNISPKQLSSIKEFLNFLPKDKLAMLATKCRSYTRALCYFEQYLVDHKNELDRYAISLQRIYVALDDTYEAAGIEMIRNTPTTVADEIANYEACGRFDKAFVCCSTSLETLENGANREPFIEDALRCLSNQGDHQRLHEKSKQLISEYPLYRRSILPYAIEATWKLCRWDELNQALKNEQVENLLETACVSQGYLLASLNGSHKRATDTLSIIRPKLMKPLSLAMMDRSAYFRGYQNLLVLHSIGDFALCLNSLGDYDIDSMELNENNIDSVRESLYSKLSSLFDFWNKRNRLVQPSLKSLEPLLVWQRSISQAISKKYYFLKDKIGVDIAQRWLVSADSAREARSFDRSFFCLTQAQRWFGSEFDTLGIDLKVRYHIERAKLSWDQGEQTKAIRDLKLSIEKLKDHELYKHLKTRYDKNKTTDPFPKLNDMEPCKVCETISQSDKESFAELKMLLTHYCEEAAAGIPETLFFMYEECVHLGVNQEETYFRLARYYDKLLAYYMENPMLCGDQAEKEDNIFDSNTQKFSQSLVSGDKEEVYTKLMEHSIIAFGNSLKYGVRYVRESMPRLLNIWYDLGSRETKSRCGPSPSSRSSNQPLPPRSTNSRINSTIRFIDELKTKHLPPYYFMTAISILLSRVTHPDSGVSRKTCDILQQLLLKYPHQITWHMIALLNDEENKGRKNAANQILSIKKDIIEKIVNDTVDFSKVIRELCFNHSPLDSKNANKKKKIGPIASLAEVSEIAAKFDFSLRKVMVPNQSSIRAIIPIDSACVNLENHEAFPEQNISYIEAFEPTVRIFNSLQRPKQVTLKCSSGKTVNLLCKSGDDLRKDSRCIEFLDLLNRILKRDNQSNARFFEIQTFLVLPLQSYTGIIEMVPNLQSLKNIMETLYTERKTNFSMQSEITRRGKKYLPHELHQIFMKNILPKVSPPVFPTWFLRKFTEPTAWYMARLAFTRTTGVISMGGYIIGLGDRHLDNILIDTCNGRIVHVDFNLLFHQGETLPQPEIVPFRLTHNIVASFGTLGTEGNFRKVCEIAMRVMRKEKDALLTTLKPFMHDPCSEWIKARSTGNKPTDVEKHVENKSAKFRIEVVERKLKGFPRSKMFKPLTLIDSYSVEAQVDNLIGEAVDTYNLSQMYFGWCPHI